MQSNNPNASGGAKSKELLLRHTECAYDLFLLPTPTLSLAKLFRTPLQLATGLFDFCAPAEGVFTAINALPRETQCKVFIDPYGGHFTLDLTGFNAGGGAVEVPCRQGTAAENKLGN